METDAETRIRKAVAAYEASYKGRKQFDPNILHPYWSEISSILTRHDFPMPEIDKMSILDIGGGSDISTVGGWDGDPYYTPDFCRYLCAMGVPQVINVDIGPQDPGFRDVYMHIQLALQTKPEFSLPTELINFGVGSTFDIITSAMLVNPTNPSPTLVDKGINPRALKERIVEWAVELLNPNGYLFFLGGIDKGAFVLRDTNLVEISESKG